MPYQTFFNLSEDKRELITHYAIEEFFEYGYEKGSISRIVANTGIAKGSFYQYFENKDDLYLYVLSVVSSKKIEYSSTIFKQIEDTPLIDIIKELFVSGVSFYRDHPKYTTIMSDFMKGRSAIHKLHKAQSVNKSNEFFTALINRKKETGEINPQLDSATLADMIAFLSVYFSENIAERLAPRYEEEEMLSAIENMLLIVKQGIENKERGV